MELRAVTDLARLKASIIAGLIVILGMIVSSSQTPMNINLVIAFLVGLFLSASTNTINDIMDREIDKFEKPNRPIPRNGISVKEAYLIFSLETVIGLLLAFYLSFYSFLLSVTVAVLSLVYSWRLKNILLVKNLITSFGISSALIVGVFATSPEIISTDILFFFLLIFTVVVTFEIHKDMADVEWDGINQKNTVPVKFGTKNTAIVVICLYLLGILFYQGILFVTGSIFEPIFLGVDIVIIFALFPVFKLLNHHSNVKYVHKTRKITMGVLFLVTSSLIFNFLTRT